MRELKFRAWDKITKQIAPVKIIEWITGVPCSIYLTLTDKVTGHACMVERTDQSAALMQFTGLKDEKDKDIYEGDILAEWCDEGWYRHGVVTYMSDHAKYYLTEPPELKYGSDSEYCYDGDEWSKLEIVGNIHQHPHLTEPIPEPREELLSQQPLPQ